MKNNNEFEADISASVYLKTNVSIKDGSGWVDAFTFCGKYGLSIHVITAWNPGETRFDEHTNEARNKELLDQLRELDCTVFEAVGRDPDSDYFEKSWAVCGLTDDVAIEIGRAFEQVAVFQIDALHQRVLNCFDAYTYSRRNLC
jgi:hypothetical protein